MLSMKWATKAFAISVTRISRSVCGFVFLLGYSLKGGVRSSELNKINENGRYVIGLCRGALNRLFRVSNQVARLLSEVIVESFAPRVVVANPRFFLVAPSPPAQDWRHIVIELSLIATQC